MKTLAFKVVRKPRGTFLSYTEVGTVLEYKLGEITRSKPGEGPMACFTNLQDTLEFLRRDWCRKSYELIPWDKIGIFLCEIEPAERIGLLLWTEQRPTFSLKNVPGSVTTFYVKLLAEIFYQPHFETLWNNSEEK